jgi:hypothetical protein
MGCRTYTPPRHHWRHYLQHERPHHDRDQYRGVSGRFERDARRHGLGRWFKFRWHNDWHGNPDDAPGHSVAEPLTLVYAADRSTVKLPGHEMEILLN